MSYIKSNKEKISIFSNNENQKNSKLKKFTKEEYFNYLEGNCLSKIYYLNIYLLEFSLEKENFGLNEDIHKEFNLHEDEEIFDLLIDIEFFDVKINKQKNLYTKTNFNKFQDFSVDDSLNQTDIDVDFDNLFQDLYLLKNKINKGI